MAKIDRRMANALIAQQVNENILKNNIERKRKTNRIKVQISATVSPYEREILDELALEFSNRIGKLLNSSRILSAAIRLAKKRKEELEIQ